LQDDDSENDSDYAPDADVAQEMADEAEGEKIVPMSRAGKRKAAELWEEMQAEDRRGVEVVMKRSLSYSTAPAPTRRKVRQRNESILAGIFGKKAAKLLARTEEAESEAGVGAEDIKERVLASVKRVQKKTKVTEIRKFAGQEIEVQRTVLQSAGPTSAPRAKGGLDDVLSTIKGPKAVSTVAKSSMDWDGFKEKEGLEEDLAAASKDGYLARKDFLDRVDVRTYEVDKAKRITGKAGGVTDDAP